ncbi:MAG: hypothetical protein JNN30_12350 [Rhodanobacteraceae bacterium]|nr:hypothetical protein [Rhodanobacteraceae bacterium]
MTLVRGVFVLLLGVAASSAVAESPSQPAQPQVWTAHGGDLGFIWNEDLLADLGMALDQRNGVGDPDRRGFVAVGLRSQGGLQFAVNALNFDHFVGGRLALRGGFRLKTPDGELSLVDATLQPRSNDALTLELVDANGRAWFFMDKLMYAVTADGRQLQVRTMDLRIHPDLARRIGKPWVDGWAIAQMRMQLDVTAQDGNFIVLGGGAPVWPNTDVPGVPGAKYQADVFMLAFDAQYSRCTRALNCAGTCSCDGPAGATDGYAVFTPNSTLRNNVNNGTAQATVAGDPLGTSSALYSADVAWFEKFTGTYAPYNNDQHPNLIWNLYRFDSEGRIDQVGRSGVKHAFLTVNVGCSTSPGSGGSNSHILGRSCSDTYATSNNDSNSDLGPRSEIIPNGDAWGRCGSIYDPNCDLLEDSSGNTNYSQRLIVRESQLASGTFRFESWYIVRDDVNVYNTMASRPVTFSFTGAGPWSISNGTPTRLGPAINQWVTPGTADPNQRNVEIANNEGHTRVAVKARDLGGGQWRYDYAVMNVDFARGVTSGTPSYDDDATPAQRFRVIHNYGYDSFSLPLPAGATVSGIEFSDGDLDTANNWTSSNSGGRLTWTAPVNPAPAPGVPAVLNPLNWGTLYRFSFIANLAPAAADIELRVAQAGTPASYAATVIAPAPSDVIFVSNFES